MTIFMNLEVIFRNIFHCGFVFEYIIFLKATLKANTYIIFTMKKQVDSVDSEWLKCLYGTSIRVYILKNFLWQKRSRFLVKNIWQSRWYIKKTLCGLVQRENSDTSPLKWNEKFYDRDGNPFHPVFTSKSKPRVFN